jgi:hypothetical protein
VTVQLSDREIEALKARTGKRSAAAALKAWAARANAKRSIAELRAALKDSLKEESTGKGRSFRSGREASVGSRANRPTALQARLWKRSPIGRKSK